MSAYLASLALTAALCGTEPVRPVGERMPTMTGDPAAVGIVQQAADSLADLYRSGITWEAFYTAVDRRRELWQRTWTGAVVPDELAERARAAGRWRILAITEPGCSDSANSLPYIARLVAGVPTLELRIVNSTAGRPWMEAHRTPDGRAATPTILLLDEQYRIRGCWVEQPAGLQSFWLDVVARGAQSREIERKMTWYQEDAGRETLTELVQILEAAHRGGTVCPGATGSDERTARAHQVRMRSSSASISSFILLSSSPFDTQ